VGWGGGGGGGVVEGEGGGGWEISWLGFVGVVGCWYWHPMDLDVGYCFWVFGSFGCLDTKTWLALQLWRFFECEDLISLRAKGIY